MVRLLYSLTFATNLSAALSRRLSFSFPRFCFLVFNGSFLFFYAGFNDVLVRGASDDVTGASPIIFCGFTCIIRILSPLWRCLFNGFSLLYIAFCFIFRLLYRLLIALFYIACLLSKSEIHQVITKSLEFAVMPDQELFS